MNLDEIEERVRQSLEALNRDEEVYDWRLSFYNNPAWANLQEGCYFLSEGQIEEITLKELIKAFRDRSRISFVDFRIKVPEPGVDEWRRMDTLFGPLDPDLRRAPPRNADDRKAYLQRKIIASMRLAMENKHVVSEKVRQQFNWLMIREKDKTPEMLAVHLNFENYNPYQKKLAPGYTVDLTVHRETIMTEETPPPAPAPMFEAAVVDNSSFEARLAPAPTVTSKRKSGPHPSAPRPREIDRVAAVWEKEEAPHELPPVIHEEFAAYCQNLYEKAQSH